MTKKDIIITSIFVNIGVVLVLFVTALTTSSNEEQETAPVISVAESGKNAVSKPHSHGIVTSANRGVDTNSQRVKQYVMSSSGDGLDISNDNIDAIVFVKSGDALEKIAKAYNTDVAQLKQANNLTSDVLQIGQKISIPFTIQNVKKEGGSYEREVYYTVQPGDSPWKIAKFNNVDLSTLLSLNNLSEESAKKLKPGDKLRTQ